MSELAIPIDMDLPAMPGVANRVSLAVANHQTTPQMLASIIETDQGIAAHVLRTCNSAAFGFQRQVDSIAQAIRLLGFEQVRDIVVAFSVKFLFKQFGRAEKQIWAHVHATALLTRLFAERFAPQFLESAYLAGLMHDVGDVLLLSAHRDAYCSIADQTPMQRLALERATFGCDHTELGAALIRRWGLSEHLVAAARFHAQPICAVVECPELVPLVCCVSLADQLCEAIDERVAGVVKVAPDPEEALALLGLTQTDYDAFLQLAVTRLANELPHLRNLQSNATASMRSAG